MMKRLLLLALVSFSILSCEKIEPTLPTPPEGFEYKTFYQPDTKAMTVQWVTGDKICMYSLKENIILYKDTVTISSISRDKTSCKVTALVAKDSDRYFATYPYNAITSEINEELNDESFFINCTGKFEDVSVMSCYVEKEESELWFHNRFSLLKLTLSRKGTVTVESVYPNSLTVSFKGTYYIPLSYKEETVYVTIKTTKSYKKQFSVNLGIVYKTSI